MLCCGYLLLRVISFATISGEAALGVDELWPLPSLCLADVLVRPGLPALPRRERAILTTDYADNADGKGIGIREIRGEGVVGFQGGTPREWNPETRRLGDSASGMAVARASAPASSGGVPPPVDVGNPEHAPGRCSNSQPGTAALHCGSGHSHRFQSEFMRLRICSRCSACRAASAARPSLAR